MLSLRKKKAYLIDFSFIYNEIKFLHSACELVNLGKNVHLFLQ